MATTWTMGQWKANMNETEKAAYAKAKEASFAKAVTAVKDGKAKAGIVVKIGDHILTLRPTGVTAKGSITYGFSPSTIQYEGQPLRLNKLSMSLLSTKDNSGVDWDNLSDTE